MRHAPKFVLPCNEPQKPAKERIVRAADLLFAQFGIHVGLLMIAHLAGTQQAVVLKYYGSLEQLQFNYMQRLFQEMDSCWREAEQSHPGDPEAQLRSWIFDIANQCGSPLSSHWQYSRLAAQLDTPLREVLKPDLDRYRRSERRKIADMCTQAKLRDPVELADKIVLLVEGARNERGSYGFRGPLDKLGAAADDLMVAHGATRKPPYDHPLD